MRANSPESAGLRITMAVIVALVGITMGTATSRPQLDPDYMKLTSTWRGEGNAFVELLGGGKPATFRARLFDDRAEQYPIPPEGDQAFYTAANLQSRSADPTRVNWFRILCGAREHEPQFTTTLVFWSDDHWSGTSRRVDCDSARSYEAAGGVTQMRSFCVVTDPTGQDRRDRCLLGTLRHRDEQAGEGITH